MQWKEFCDRFPVRLNVQQQEAVRAVDGAVLLLAVPGSGKTTVLVARLGYMIYCCGIAPEKILTVTYTVAATKDMALRFAGFFGEEMAQRLEFRTINGICAKVIAYCSRVFGREAFELVTDEKKTAGMLSQIYQQIENEYPTESDLKNVRTLITYIKNRMLAENEIKALEADAGIQILAVYKEYCRQLRERGWMDYDDQMIYAYNMLQKIPEVRKHFQDEYPYICVDEAQDTSKIQHAIIELLAAKTGNLFMVGDEDQSIYGFRAAYPEALLSFEKNHEHAKVLMMEENFRSNAVIVEAADRFIQRNTKRHKKHMKATKEAESEIRVIPLKGRRAQYAYLAQAAKDCKTQTAVLYRDNESVVPLVDLLERGNIPYRIRNMEPTFFTNRVVLDIENIMRLALEPDNVEAFLQVYYKIGTYLKKQDAFTICEISRQREIPVLDAAIDFAGVSEHTRGSLRAVRTHLRNMLEEPGDRAIRRIVRYMGYGDYLKRNKMKDGKIFLLQAVGAREESPQAFLERMHFLQSIFAEKKSDAGCPFILSTIHASKGLEYDTVYLMDVEDGIFPEEVPKGGKRMLDKERETFEEERRLFYVGATRAKNQLILFNTGEESLFRSQLLGREEEERPKATVRGTAKRQEKFINPYQRRSSNAMENEAAEVQQFVSRLQKGMTVHHSRFGDGEVLKVSGSKVKIRFADKEREFDIQMLCAGKLLTIR